jgi:hypothetical protein
MEKKTSSRISTEVELISTLISGINKGEIKIPKFQRKFVWKDDPYSPTLVWRGRPARENLPSNTPHRFSR